MKKTKFIKLFFVSVITAAILVASTGCSSSKVPELSEVYDRYVTLIENAVEINTVFFGDGLPVYDRDGAEAKLLNMYYAAADDGNEYVKPYSMYQGIEHIKREAEKVYGDEYLESLYESLFTGYTAEELGSVLPARYYEDEKNFYQNSGVTPLIEGAKVYDYSTMNILPESTATLVRVEIEAYEDSNPTDIYTAKLSFVYENGDWYLNSPC